LFVAAVQAQLFEICAMDELVEAAVQGYHVTIFAFGQTGSGKTYSIIGPSISRMQASATGSLSSTGVVPLSPPFCSTNSKHPLAASAPVSAVATCSGEAGGPDVVQQTAIGCGSSADSNRGAADTAFAQAGEQQGLLPRCVEHLYKHISACRQELRCNVMASCCEIYNEAVTDLLASNKTQQLQVSSSFACLPLSIRTQPQLCLTPEYKLALNYIRKFGSKSLIGDQ
jgi:hypothetical protein